MMKSNPVSITIAIPTFNRIDLLKRTMASVLNQTEKPNEIIVVDNCSTDGTWEYLKTLKGIKICRNKTNIGPVGNYNETIKRATSEYVVSLASDDILLPNYIKTWKKIIAKQRKDIVAFTSAGYIIDVSDKVLGIVRPMNHDMILFPPKTLKVLWEHYQFTLELSCWTVYKRDIFDKVGFFTSEYGRIIDMKMAMKILPHFPIYYCTTPLCAFRHHPLQTIMEKLDDVDYEREFNDRINAGRLLFDFEKDPFIKSSFTKQEQKDRIFIRKPLMFVLITSIYYFIFLDFSRFLKYFNIYKNFYPRPFISKISIRLFLIWIINLISQLINNYFIRLKFRNKDYLKQA